MSRPSLLTALVLLLVVAGLPAVALDRDQHVVIFPGYGHLDATTNTWKAVVHGWVFEPEADSVTRALFLAGLRQVLQLDGGAEETALFKARLRPFLVDNKSGIKLDVKIAGETKVMAASQANGHFFGLVFVPAAPPLPEPLPVTLVLAPEDDRKFAGELQLIPPTGVSVISDLDDTVKASNVLDRQELLANTFLRPFQAVPGMSAKYRAWATAGARFHYVSASPWQLYEPLAAFLTAAGLPVGTFHLKYFRVKDRSLVNLFADPEAFKREQITAIFRDFPQRRFVLVGDTGEHDPQVYAEMARRYPEQVAAVYLRAVREADRAPGHFAAVFHDVPNAKWRVFAKPEELPDALPPAP